MTNQITIPRETWDAVRGALKDIAEESFDKGAVECANHALAAANAVSRPQATEPNDFSHGYDIGYEAGKLHASQATEPAGCDKCRDPDGIPCFPQYGVGPHTCFYKIPGAKIGQSQPLPKDQWPYNYREDPDCPGMGVYWCPHCGSGKPAAPEAP